MKSEEEKIGTICDGFLRKPITRADLIGILVRFLKNSTVTPPPGEPADQEEPCFEIARGDIHDPEGLQQRLETDLLPLWEEIKDSVIVNQVLEFAEKAIAIAAAHKATRLAAWGDRLRNQAMLFDLSGMEQSLAAFPKFLTPQAGLTTSPISSR